MCFVKTNISPKSRPAWQSLASKTYASLKPHRRRDPSSMTTMMTTSQRGNHGSAQLLPCPGRRATEDSGVGWRKKLRCEWGNAALRLVLLVQLCKALTDLQLHDLALLQDRRAILQGPSSPFLRALSPLHRSARSSAMLPLPSNQTERTVRFASMESDFCNAPAFSRRPRTVELSSVLQALGASRCAQDLS